MAGNFFNGTLDDFLDGTYPQSSRPPSLRWLLSCRCGASVICSLGQLAKLASQTQTDPALFALASLALPLNSQSPPRSLRISPVRSVPSESSTGSRFGAGRGFRDAAFGVGEEGSVSTLPLSDLGTALELRPTWAGPSNNVNARPPAAYRPRLNASSRTGGISNPPNNFPLPLNFLPLQAPAHPTASPALNPSRVASTSPTIDHGVSNPASPSTLSPGQSRSGNLNSSRNSLVRTRPRGPSQEHTNNTAATANFTTAASTRRPALQRAALQRDNSIGPGTMSSSARRRSARPPNALTLPAPPSQPRASSQSNSRPAARSSSRPLQPEPSSSTQKRKRDDLASDDLFGDSFAGHEVVDLVDTDEVPAEMLLSQEKNKNQVKLRTFDCVICMDNAKEMTVTHCGMNSPSNAVFDIS